MTRPFKSRESDFGGKVEDICWRMQVTLRTSPRGQPARKLGPQSYNPKEPESVDHLDKLRGT